MEKHNPKEEEPTESDGCDIEPVLQALGPRGLGLYQLSQMGLAMATVFGVGFSILSVVFIGYQPSYRCADVNVSKLERLIGQKGNFIGQPDIVYEKCSIHVTVNQSEELQMQHYSLPCVEGYEYASDKHTSFFTEWDLTCEKRGLTELTQTLMMVGQAVGAFVFSSLSDRIGRKPVHVTCTLGLLVLAVASALAPNYIFLICCRVVTGALQQGSSLVGFTMVFELMPKWLRGTASIIDASMWSFCVMLLSLLAFLMQDYSWRYLQFLIAAFSIYSICLPWYMDESLRWLVANGKTKAAERVAKRACRLNGVQYHTVHAVLKTVMKGPVPSKSEVVIGTEKTDMLSDQPDEAGNSINSEQKAEKFLENQSWPTQSESGIGDQACVASIDKTKAEVTEMRKYTVIDILKHSLLRKTTCILSYVWTANSLTYYGVALTSSTLAGNRFLNFFLQALVEVPAFFTVYFGLGRFGRRNVACTFFCVTSISLLASSILLATVSGAWVGPFTNVLSFTGKFGLSGSYAVLFILCPELFPTNLRTAGTGVASTVSRLGGMVAPFSISLAEVALWGPGIIFGCMSSLSAVLILRVPETRGRPLPTTIDEMKAWQGKTPSSSQPTTGNHPQAQEAERIV